MRYMKYILVVVASLALFACGNKSGTTTGIGVISLNGGNGGTAAGGNGGKITTAFKNSTSAVRGDLRFHAGGSVDVSFALPTVTTDFGSNPAVINSSTSVIFVNLSTSGVPRPLPATGTYYIDNLDNNLHLAAAGQTNVTNVVTGLTVASGATLKLPNPNTNGFTQIPGAVVINGIVTKTTIGDPLDLRSGSLLLITPSGKVSTTAATIVAPPASPPAGSRSGLLKLLSGGVLINQGIVDSNGTDGDGTTAGGASGGVTLEAGTFLYNTVTVNAKGGNNAAGAAGAGGPIQLIADKASFFTNGTIDASGGTTSGTGTNGGAAGGITIIAGNNVAALPSTTVGRAVISGILTSKGGDCTGTATGNGGNGANISLSSFSGGILVNVTSIDASGGIGLGAGNAGGASGNLLLNNFVGDNVSPEGIKVAGSITLNGGDGNQGGNGGTISLASGTAPSSLQGFGNVEFFGYQSITLNGGASTSGTGGTGGIVKGVLGATQPIVRVDIPVGTVFNEVAISARGGDVKSNNGTGGVGGQLTFITPFSNPPAIGAADPSRSLVTNSGAIDVSGGAGTAGVTATVGGAGGNVTMSGYGTTTISGSINTKGGIGTTNGGVGGVINLTSTGSNVANSATLILSGGDGATGGTGGKGGTATLTSANQTINSAAILANGGNSSGGTGGDGGSITLLSGYGSSNSGSRNVAKGSGGATNTAKNGTVTVDGVIFISPTTPNSSGII